MWTGRFYVIAIDYDSYVILKVCPIYTNQGKNLSCEYLKIG